MMEMKNGLLNMVCAMIMFAGAFSLVQVQAGKQDNDAMTKLPDGTYVVNTTTLASGVKGYRSTTPLKIYIKNVKTKKYY